MDETNWCLHCEKFLDSDRHAPYCSVTCESAESPSTSQAASISGALLQLEQDLLHHHNHCSVIYQHAGPPSTSGSRSQLEEDLQAPPQFSRILSWAQGIPSGPQGIPDQAPRQVKRADHSPRQFKRPPLLGDITKRPSGTVVDKQAAILPEPSPPMDTPVPPFRSDDTPTPSPLSALTESSVSTPSSSLGGAAQPVAESAVHKKASFLSTLTTSLRFPGQSTNVSRSSATPHLASATQLKRGSTACDCKVVPHLFNCESDSVGEGQDKENTSSFCTPSRSASRRHGVEPVAASTRAEHSAYQNRGRRTLRFP